MIIFVALFLSAPAPVPRKELPITLSQVRRMHWGGVIYLVRFHPDGRYEAGTSESVQFVGDWKLEQETKTLTIVESYVGSTSQTTYQVQLNSKGSDGYVIGPNRTIVKLE